jgi:polar amino acid transport system permease protein
MEYLPYQVRYIVQNLPAFADGLLTTLQIGFLAMVLALIWGLVLVVPRRSEMLLLRLPARFYIELMRNTPLLVQMFLIYFGLPMFGVVLSGFLSGMVAIALQHGAFLAEIYRGAIEAVPQGQWQAARAIGMRRWQVMQKVILPQAFYKILAPLGNQMVLLVKDTSLVAAIGVVDLTLTGKMIIERSAATFEIFITIAVIYLVLTSLVGSVTRAIEHRVSARK